MPLRRRRLSICRWYVHYAAMPPLLPCHYCHYADYSCQIQAISLADMPVVVYVDEHYFILH
jgi:hypothetical protein